MSWILLSSVLFGLVHPGSKMILTQGISVIDFCILYVSVRLISQFPFYIKKVVSTPSIKNFPWHLLVLFGLVGAALQFSEFFGLSKGLPVSTVTFLVYSHPVWSLILSHFVNKEKIGTNEVIRVLIGILGIYFISYQIIKTGVNFDLKIIAPIFAGFLIALWSSLSNKLRKSGLTAFDVSFFYDLFAFIALVLIAQQESTFYEHSYQIWKWVQSPLNIFSIIFFSIFVGLLPNYLFYLGSGTCSNLNASLLLLIEPVVATTTAFLFMNETVTPLFFLGAIFILLSGINYFNYYSIYNRYLLGFLKFRYFFLFLFLFYPFNLLAKKLYLVEVTPRNQLDYTISDEMKLIDSSAKLAMKKTLEIFPKCEIQIITHLQSGTDEELFNYLSNINNFNDQVAVVGLSRSIFARIGARALQNKNILGISIGASSANFNKINNKFYSVVSPLKSQVEKIRKESLVLGCKTILGIFDSKDPLSADYKASFLEVFGKNGKTIDLDSGNLTKGNLSSCVFIGLNFSKSVEILRHISDKKVTQIFGTGDWSIHATELENAISIKDVLKNHQKIHTPSGWYGELNKKSSMFNSIIKNKFKLEPNPLGAYTFDSLLIASEYLCEKKPVSLIIEKGKTKSSFLRNYTGISDSQNIISKMNMIHFRSKQ